MAARSRKRRDLGLALVGCAGAALVENDNLGWVWSLLIAALVTFAGAVDLVILANKRSKDLLFYATRWPARLIGRA
jgi:hypothetical protein